ncbi:MAG: hypothetical protein R2698_14270 [Microthrixaceae bacterium]
MTVGTPSRAAGSRRVTAVLLTVLVVTGLLGCTGGDDESSLNPRLVPTSLSPLLRGDLVPPTTSPTPSTVAAGLGEALESGNFCMFLHEMDSAPTTFPADLIGEYRDLVEKVAMAARRDPPSERDDSKRFLPWELRGSWTVLHRALTEAATAIERSGGNLRDADALAAMRSGNTLTAIRRIERYQYDHCLGYEVAPAAPTSAPHP